MIALFYSINLSYDVILNQRTWKDLCNSVNK